VTVLPADERLERWWVEYKATGAREARDRLLVYYMPLVRAVAARIASGLARHVDEHDLAADGVFGLIDAIEKYEPARNVRFETYATARIRGAIGDALRSMDWVPRSVRASGRQVEKTREDLAGRLGRSPSTAEMAAAMDVTEAELDRILRSGLPVLPIDGPSDADESPRSRAEVLCDPRDQPAGEIDVERMKQVLAAAVSRLDDRERIVMTLGYHDGLSFADIGIVLGLSTRRVTQIHTKTMVRLQADMAEGLLP
jgi:RNA polymerase sigma factor for flagellar operon FliA